MINNKKDNMRIKMNTKQKFNKYRIYNEAMKDGQISVFNNILLLDKLKKELVSEIEKGCDYEFSNGNVCGHTSSRGNKNYCHSCKRMLKYLEEN